MSLTIQNRNPYSVANTSEMEYVFEDYRSKQNFSASEQMGKHTSANEMTAAIHCSWKLASSAVCIDTQCTMEYEGAGPNNTSIHTGADGRRANWALPRSRPGTSSRVRGTGQADQHSRQRRRRLRLQRSVGAFAARAGRALCCQKHGADRHTVAVGLPL